MIQSWPRFTKIRRLSGLSLMSGASLKPWLSVTIGVFALLVLNLFCVMPTWSQERALRKTIDAEVAAGWQREKITPASPATDAEFLRRVNLDLVGVIPNYDETVAFLKDTATDKREKLVDRLLDDPRFAQHQADLWDMILFGRNPPGFDTDKREGVQRWLREQFAANRPYDVWVRDLLRAEGNSLEQGPPMYYVQYRNQPEDLNEVVTQTFLGVQLQCARCHDHPFDSWKQVDFYGMAAFFARLEVVQVGKKDNVTMYAIGEKNSGDVLFTGPAKDQKPGKKGDPIKPKFLAGNALDEPAVPAGYKEVKFEANKPPPPPTFSRKDQFADWVTRPDNPYFARAIANRIWAQFLGHGIVHPIDNLSPANKPSHPELLDALAKYMVESRFDLKAYIRELVNSRPYQLSSIGATGEPQPIFFEHARTRPLSAEELAESWRVATGYDIAAQGDAKKNKSRFRPLESGYVLRFFGQPTNGVGDFQGGLAEHLYMNNGPMGSLIVSGSGSLLAAVSNREKSWEERVDQLYLQILNRPPQAEERQRVVEFLSSSKDSKDAEERPRDAIWAFLTCSEFRFNH